jgi:glyceraldehyde 3-phosphate dehydrogenase
MRCGAIMNGFGRFGLHFLAYYLDRAKESNFTLLRINDEHLSFEDMLESIRNDHYVKIASSWEIEAERNVLFFRNKFESHKIEFENLSLADFAANHEGILLECSGKYANTDLLPELSLLERIYISATSLNADSTILVGFNEDSYNVNQRILSYGSCTVNSYVPLASALNNEFGVINSDVNVIHNIPEYLLRRSPGIFERRTCTLSFMGPRLLKFLSDDNFNVNYTVVPITGVSRIDLRFELEKQFEINEIVKAIENLTNQDGLKLYRFLDSDNGPNDSLLSVHSTEFLLSQSRKVGQSLYLSGYFDTENSVNRYYDLIQTIERETV